MAWFYSEKGRQAGPVDDPTFASLVNTGKITPETLVWRNGMSAWSAYGKVTAESIPSTDGQEPCYECKGLFAPDDLVQIGDSVVCVTCKPLAVQKLKEGVKLAGRSRYAGFWIRGGAKLLDEALLGGVQVAINSICMGPMLKLSGTTSSRAFFILMGASAGCSLLIRGTYSTWLIGKYGATLGKMTCGLRVIKSDGQSLTYRGALGRYGAELLSKLILYIGYIMAAFDEEKRTLHDRICDTRVVYR